MNRKPDESNPDLQGEGNYVAGRHYNDATKQFVDEGKVEQAAAAARPESPEEARRMDEAFQEEKQQLMSEIGQAAGTGAEGRTGARH